MRMLLGSMGCFYAVVVGFLFSSTVVAQEPAASSNAVSSSRVLAAPVTPTARPVMAGAPVRLDSFAPGKKAPAVSGPDIVHAKAPATMPESLKPSTVNEYYFYNTYLAYKLGIGTRIKHFTLLDDQRGLPKDGSFFGTVTQLREDQDFAPVGLYVEYRITPHFGVGIAYDKFSVEAGDWGAVEGGGGSDGTLKLSGPLFYLLGLYPNSTRFTPFCELGYAVYSADFDASEGWGANGLRYIEVDGAKGYYLGLGCDVQVQEYVSIDLYWRYMRISDVEGAWFSGPYELGDVVLTPSYMSIGLGAKFLF